MVRETRHLWVGNLPENIREDRIRDHFKRYGRVQSVKLLGGRGEKDEVCATVSFMDIKSAAKAHHSEQKLDERLLTTEYHEPAAIPTPNYSRFHLVGEELSSSFDRSSHFYERGERGEGAGGYIRRSGYHSGGESLARTRPRDRGAAYRNGPYTPIIESVVSRSGSSGSHHGSSTRSAGGGSWSYESPSPRYPPSTPDISYPEPPSIIVHKKHSKSRSGSDSGSNSSRSRSSSASSQSGSSTCSTASSSPTSEKSCSTHSQQSTLRSSGVQSSTANHTSSGSPAVHSEDRRPLAICVRNLPARSSDTSLKDGLYHEYKKHGKVTWVKVVGQGVDRYALVSFKKPEDVDKALQVSHDKLFFGCKIEVAPYQGYDVDDNEFRPFEAEQDEFHPKATRTLFIGNLDKDITTQDIRKHFDQFGEIIDIDIKKQGTSSSYAFCQFSDIGSVVRAMRSLDGEHVGGNRVKLGFGKSMHTSCVWVDGVAESVSEKYLSQQFGQFGPVSHVVIDRARGQALVSYEQIPYAQQAVKEMRGAVLRGRKLQVDYASRECQESFYDHMEKQSTTTTTTPTTITTHPPFENSTSVGSSPQQTVLRVFESPSSSTSSTQCPPVTGTASRYTNSCRYTTSSSSGRGFPGRAVSPTRSSRPRFQEYTPGATSNQEYDRRTSYRSYEDVNQIDESGTPAPGGGDIRHLQKERVSLLEQLEDCTSSGEEGTNRRRCNKHRRSASGEGSRPGTPLCDERPEGPVEPRRPRESRPNEVISLPLPRFASQVLSPRPAPPSPPASPQTHSSSSDSEPSPEWEERLRSLDEKYEKWSGSRSGLTKPDTSSLRVRHKLLELDLHELQPSEIVKSVLAKRSVFDEDSKRLENFGEKYEPREFVPARSSLLRGRLDLSPMSSPVVKSPSSPAAKGLQYPFPSHPPVQTGVPPPAQEIKPPTTAFLTNCTSRQFPPPKISSPQAEKCDPRTPPAKVPSLPAKPPTPVVTCKPIQEVKKDPVVTHTKVKSTLPLRRESSDDKKEEVRRKSRDESVESVKSVDSVKRDDLSECDKVKDAQITERRKSISEKRRSSSDIKDTCERTKDTNEKRRGSSETEAESKKVEKKLFDENHMDIPKPVHEIEKNRKVPNDSTERRKENDTNIRHSIDIDKKKDILGVNSEKDRRRNRESTESSDNPKHKKVPENKKELELIDKREKDEDIKIIEPDRKKEISDSCTTQHLNRHKEKKDHQERRRDSSEHSDKKMERISPENSEVHRIREKKSNHDLSEPRNSKKHHDDSDVKCDNVKHKDSERRKNSENEISKEHSLFKKVFGFAERTYGHHKDRRDSDSTAVKTDDNIKHKRDHSEKERKKDKESDHSESSSKHRSRKSPDQPENNRHKERKHSESSEKRSRKEYDLSDDHKQKDDHTEIFHSKSHRKEDRSKDSGKHIYSIDQEYSSLGKQERRKETSLDELRISESDSNDLKMKDGECKKDNEVFYERRKDDISENKNKDERRRDSEKYFESEKYNNDRIKKDESDLFKDLDKKNDSSEYIKFKHERHNDRKKEIIVENCRTKEQKDDQLGKHKDDRKNDEIFDSLKSSKDDNFRYRDYSRRKDSESQDHIRIKDILDGKKKEEKEKKKDREAQEFCFKKVRDPDDKTRISEKPKHKKDFEISEPKMNGDHDDYLDNIDCRKPSYEEDIRIDPIKKEKKKDRNNTWPATIGCKRRLSSQDSLDIVEDAKRSKPERRDSKDSGRSSGSSRKGSSEKHKGFTKLLEEKIKEDKEHEQRKKEELILETNEKNDDKILKPAIRKEKRNSGEKRKEERKFKSRPRENGTASESDMASGDDEISKANKRQHSIFDIVDDEPAYISMYDKVKARSTKNMQKQEEEKRQEKLKEKFHQLKASRAKREEKKRSTSYDEDSDSEKGSSRRSNKLLITSSDDDGCSESDMRIRARKILCDTSEDDTINAPRTHLSKFSEYDSKSSRKIISDISEDDSVIKHSTPKMKSSRNISFESDIKSRKIMSDTSEDDITLQNIPTIPRQKPSRIQSDESEGDLGFEDSIRAETSLLAIKPPFLEPPMKITDVFTSRPVEMNHFTSTDHEQKQHQLQSSPESLRRISLDSATSEQPRKKSHKKKQKKKNYEVSEDGTIIIRKHSSKKEKKKSHRDNDDEDKKSRKKKSERDGSSKREEKYEDIFGPLSDDSEKAAISKWQVSQVYGSDSESERENIRKKEKKRREKKQRELDEAGRALEAKLLDTSEDIIEEPIKTKKKKRKKSRDEKIKHHRIIDEESTPATLAKDCDSSAEIKKIETEDLKDSEQDIKLGTDNDREDEDDDDDECKMVIDYEEHIHKEESSSVVRQHSSSLSSLLDSPPAQPSHNKKPDIPGFGSEVDENIHETAVKSISEANIEEQISITQDKYEVKTKQEEQPPSEDKPTPVISQEETEDAVAALLMEDTFGSISGFERYSEDTPKPDTPISEPDLQIDTDTEDTFDQVEFSKQTPRESDEDQSSFYQQNDTREGLEERILPLACSSESTSIKESGKSVEVAPVVEAKEEPNIPKPEPDSFEESQTSEEEALSKEKPVGDIKNDKENKAVDIIPKNEPAETENKNLLKSFKNESESSTVLDKITENIKPVQTAQMESKSRLEPIETIPKTDDKPIQSPTPVEQKPITEIKTEQNIKEVKEIDVHDVPINDIIDPPIKSEQVQPPEVPIIKSEPIQQNVKVVNPEKCPEPTSPIMPLSQPQISPKAEKVVHHQGVPVNHTTVLVHQTLQQPQTAQMVKPLTIQMINHPPALKPLEQPIISKSNQVPPVSMTLNSPPSVLSSTTLAPSFQPKPQQTIQTPVTKPIHHVTSFQGIKHSNPIPHLVPAHLPVKPATQISLQTPQLTPISKGSPAPPARPLVVHTIQNHSTQKQLHIVTPSSQLSPQPHSPQNLKVIRPVQSQVVNIRPPLSPQTTLNRPPLAHNTSIPLLQTVTATEPSLNKQFNIRSPLTKINHDLPNSHIFHGSNQIPHPEKVMNLSPSHPGQTTPVPLTPSLKTAVVTSVKTNEVKPFIQENNIDGHHPIQVHDKKVINVIAQENVIQKPLVPSQLSALPLTKPLLQAKVEEPQNENPVSLSKPQEEPQQNRLPVFEPKLIKPLDEPKPLNAVIQDLTMRAATKALIGKPPALSSAIPENKCEVPKPLEQVVRELQLRKKASSLPNEPEKPNSPKLEEPSKEVSEITKTDPIPHKDENKEESPKIEVPKIEIKKPEEKVENEEKPEEVKVPNDSSKTKDNSKIEKEEVPNTPPSTNKTERKATPEPNPPEPITPKSHKESEPESPAAPEEKVSAEKTPPVITGSGRGRGGRGRGKRGRGAGTSMRGRGGGRGGSSSSLSQHHLHHQPLASSARQPPSAIPPPADVYEFRDDSEEERPRLILTIKPDQTSSSSSATTNSSNTTSSPSQPPAPSVSTHNAPSTRKSRRLQEKDGTKAVVEEVEEVVRSSGRPGRRATRSTAPLLSVPTTVENTRKSPRRKQPRDRTSHDRSPTPQPTQSPQPTSVASQPTSVTSQPTSVTSQPTSVTSQPTSVTSQPTSVTSQPASSPQPTASPSTQLPVAQPQTPQQPPPTRPQTPSPSSQQKDHQTSLQSPSVQPERDKEPPLKQLKDQPQPQKEPIQQLRDLKTIPPRDHQQPQPPPPQQQLLQLQQKPQPPPQLQLQLQQKPLPQPVQNPQPHPVQKPQPQPVQKPQPVLKPLPQSIQKPQPQPVQKPQPLLPVQKSLLPCVKLPAKLMMNKGDLKTMIPHGPGEVATPARSLVDPVTGILIPMREAEEGQYVPMGGGDGGEPPPEKKQRMDDTVGVTKAIAAIRPSVVRQPQSIPKPTSPPHLPQKLVVSNPVPRPPKAHLLQAVAAECTKIVSQPRPKLTPPQIHPIQAPKPPPTPLTPKAHILQAIGNAREGGIIGSPAPHQGSILTGSVASPPLRTHPQPIVTGASSGRFLLKGHNEPPGGRVGPEGGCIVVPTPSPQAPPRGQVMQAGLPVPAYEASLHGVVAELLPNPQWPRQQSPPPAHQHSTQTQGEVVQHVNYPGHHIQPAHYVHPQLMYQQYLREAALGTSPYHRAPDKIRERSGESNARPLPGEARFQPRSSDILVPSHRPRASQTRGVKEAEEGGRGSPPLELSRRRASPHDRTTDSPQVATLYGRTHLFPPLAHRPAASSTRHQVATPPHASQVPPQADSLLVLLQRYPVMWQGLLALKNDQAAVQMHFVFGNPCVARDSLPCNSDGSTPPLRIAQRMRLEQTQLDGVARKMQMDNEHCMLLALPCGRDHMDVLQQSNNLQCGFITYLQQKQAAGIINVAAPGFQQAAYVVHIFPASEFANDSLARIAPDLLHRVTDIAHLLIVIATV